MAVKLLLLTFGPALFTTVISQPFSVDFLSESFSSQRVSASTPGSSTSTRSGPKSSTTKASTTSDSESYYSETYSVRSTKSHTDPQSLAFVSSLPFSLNGVTTPFLPKSSSTSSTSTPSKPPAHSSPQPRPSPSSLVGDATNFISQILPLSSDPPMAPTNAVSRSFFGNKAAVAGTFVVVSIIILGALLFGAVTCWKRRSTYVPDRDDTSSIHGTSVSPEPSTIDLHQAPMEVSSDRSLFFGNFEPPLTRPETGGVARTTTQAPHPTRPMDTSHIPIQPISPLHSAYTSAIASGKLAPVGFSPPSDGKLAQSSYFTESF